MAGQATEYIDGQLYMSEDVNIDTTSTNPYLIASAGDTVVLQTQRTIATSDSDGYVGEICLGQDSGVYYLYYCTQTGTGGSAQWVRTALSTW